VVKPQLKEPEYLPQRRKGRKEKKQYFSELGVLRALAGGYPHPRCSLVDRQSEHKINKILFHRRDAEFAEVGVFLDQKFFSLRPRRLGGEFS